MPKYIGNCANQIDWTSVIDGIKDKTPEYEFSDPSQCNSALGVDENEHNAQLRHSAMLDDLKINLTKKVSAEYASARVSIAETISKSWNDAGIKLSRISWEGYYPGKHFDNNITDRLVDILDLKEMLSFSIIKLSPAMVAPWHFDVAPDYYNQAVTRCVIFIQLPVPGQTLSFKDITYWNETIGNIYEWEDREVWHCAANASLIPYYTAHIEGIKK